MVILLIPKINNIINDIASIQITPDLLLPVVSHSSSLYSHSWGGCYPFRVTSPHHSLYPGSIHARLITVPRASPSPHLTFKPERR